VLRPHRPGLSRSKFGVCLSLFSSSAARRKFRARWRAGLTTTIRPGRREQHPSPVPVPEIRGGAGYFLDFSTSARSRSFSQGKRGRRVEVVCYGGGDDCGSPRPWLVVNTRGCLSKSLSACQCVPCAPRIWLQLFFHRLTNTSSSGTIFIRISITQAWFPSTNR